MRSRIIPAIGASTVAVLAAAAFAAPASAGSSTGVTATHASAGTVAAGTVAAGSPAWKAKCFNVTQQDSGVAIISDDFADSGLGDYDSAAAMDFTLKKKCTLKKVWTTGVYFNGAGPADSVSLIIYKDRKGVPGKVLKEELNISYADTTGTGSLRANGKKITLKKGSYWLSFVATMTFASGGEWGWELSSGVVGLDDMWENPGGGLGTPCATWGTIPVCLGYTGDLMVKF